MSERSKVNYEEPEIYIYIYIYISAILKEKVSLQRNKEV
jgi:hypothetical protein